ncbi:glycosyl transferase [Bacteroidia bacterium]|nr:glycosyl transferase [Bacteroidia bacterium]
MKIAIISTRGIPNNYGGFEQFAEHLSVGLVVRGHEVLVYSPHFHPYKENSYKGVKIKHIYSPEPWLGSSIGSFFYDFNSLRDALKKEKIDIIYEAGYTSIVPAFIWFNIKSIKSPVVVTNMDGLEYRRSKFNSWARKFIFWEERQAVKHSHHLIADNLGIRDYYKEKYGKDARYFAYGANIAPHYNSAHLREFHLSENNYYLVIARLEPENNIEMIIEGYLQSRQSPPLIIIGKTNTAYGKWLQKKYAGNALIRFLGGIYDADKINALRRFSVAYFHGHSVGGTNPSLLEAMAAGCFVIAHDNPFNKAVLDTDALYFNSSDSIAQTLNHPVPDGAKAQFIENNLEKIRRNYSWEQLIEAYEAYFLSVLSE